MSNEALVQQQIRLALGRVPGLVLLRNNIGTMTDRTGRVVSFGVGGKGGSDLIGWRTVNGVAVFCAIEIKDRGSVTPDQRRFLDAVQRAGGIAGVARDVEEARAILGVSGQFTLAAPVQPL